LVREAGLENISEYIVEGYTEDKLQELYANEILTFEGLKQLNEKGVVQGEWNEVIERYNKLRRIEEEMKRFISSGDIINTTEDEPSRKKSTRFKSEKTDKTEEYKTTISSDTREDFFDALGCIRYGYKDENGAARYFTKEQKESLNAADKETLEKHELRREILESKSLSGYEIVLIPELDIAILEKKKEGNATYVMNLHNAFEKMKYDTKKDLQEDSTVVRSKHTKGWGKNVITAISEINGFDKKELLKKYQTEIVKIVEDYELNKEIRDMERHTREEG